MVGLIERMNINAGDLLKPYIRPGVVVAEAPGKTCLWLQYDNDTEADAAAEKLRDALSRAIRVGCGGSKR